jgi:hypothetical protein
MERARYEEVSAMLSVESGAMRIGNTGLIVGAVGALSRGPFVCICLDGDSIPDQLEAIARWMRGNEDKA